MAPGVLIPLPGNEDMAARLATRLGARVLGVELRSFPDGETYLRLLGEPRGVAAAVVCTLDHPDAKALPLIFAAAAARDLGATSVGLIAPYLAYMRQDARFLPGEAVTSSRFARLLSRAFDWLVTVDPHLHRHAALAEIYDIPARAVHVAPQVAAWISLNVANPVIVGPDAESGQWVSRVADLLHAPFMVSGKRRRGDRDVAVRLQNPERLAQRTPVIVDDIISSGETMIATVEAIGKAGGTAPVCVAVHGIFAERSQQKLEALGARVVVSNTIAGPHGLIDVSGPLAEAIATL